MEKYPGLHDPQIERWLDDMVEQQTWLFPLKEIPPEAIAALRELMPKSPSKLQVHTFHWSVFARDERRLFHWARGCSIQYWTHNYCPIDTPDDFLCDSKWEALKFKSLLNTHDNLGEAKPTSTELHDELMNLFLDLSDWIAAGDDQLKEHARAILRLCMYALPVSMTTDSVYLVRLS